MYRADKIHLQGIYLGSKYRDIGTLVFGLPYPVLPIVETTEDIYAEPERNRRFQHGNMVFECLVEILHTAHCQCITVNFQHKRENLQLVVADESAHGHVRHLAALLVLEHQHPRQFLEFRTFLQHHITSTYLHDAAHGRSDEIHIGIQ